MLQIDNHEEQALYVVVPYLLQFPEIYGLAKNSGTRTQNVEDVAWELLWNLDIDTAEGTWLDYLGKKVGQTRVYSPTVDGAFTFGGTTSEGFGAGNFLSSALTGSNTKIARTDALFRNAIRAKILQNNTDCSLDELINSCKLLYNASLVLVNESYPAGIESIYLYGSSLLKSNNANAEIKKMIPAGVSLTHVYFEDVYNIFKNNAFISYNSDYLIPSTDDFELSFSFKPDTVNSSYTPLLSQGESFSSKYNDINLYYNSSGVYFDITPQNYSNGVDVYSNGSEEYIAGSSDAQIFGGSINANEINTIKITRNTTGGYTDGLSNIYVDGNGIAYDDNKIYEYKMYINDVFIDSAYSNFPLITSLDTNLFLGCGIGESYNSGAINSIYLYNNTTSTIILNDTLKLSTIGTNNGVIFL